MAAKTTAPASAGLKIGVADIPYYHAPLATFVEGTDIYSKLRVNGPVELELEGGKKVPGTVTGIQVGALIELIAGYGPQSFYTANRAYSALSVVQHLADAAGVEVLDVTKLYVAVLVQAQPPEG